MKMIQAFVLLNSMIALFGLASANAGSHVEPAPLRGSYTFSSDSSPVTDISIASARYEQVVLSTSEYGSCNPQLGNLADCHSVSTYGYKVRVTVEYTSPAGANPSPDVSEDAQESGVLELYFDFDPAQFDAATLAKIQAAGDARDLFSLTQATRSSLATRVDYNQSTYCSPEAPSDCESELVSKTEPVELTSITVQLK